MVLRMTAVAALLMLATSALAVAQVNNQQHPGGARPPGTGNVNPAFRPGSQPSGARTFGQAYPGPHPGFAAPPPAVTAPRQAPFMALRPPVTAAPSQRGFVGAPPPATIAPSQPGFVATAPAGSATPQPNAGSIAATQFTWHGRSFERLHGPPFVYPYGYAYQRWPIGAILPQVFLLPVYFYPDWAVIGLDPPPPDCAWVRYGPDLLLANIATGEVIDTIYDAFD